MKDCPGTYNIHHDLRVAGATYEEHDENLLRVVRNLEESSLLLDYEKCEVGINNMEDALTELAYNHQKNESKLLAWAGAQETV